MKQPLRQIQAMVGFVLMMALATTAAPTCYDVMDELGMLMEPEFTSTPADLKKIPEYIAYEKTVVSNVISKLWNHPSIVIWSDDNEGSSAKADPVHSLNHKALHETIRRLDPTRPTDSNGNNSLFSVKKLYNINFKPDVFNVHPYGNPSYPEVKRQMLDFNWDGETPVYMGELFTAAGGSSRSLWTWALSSSCTRALFLRGAD
ncbi:MAG: glycoside hydrolase family 2 TIM barrel-domain containing protein [Kiritimatiellae bacterium]|nr:glycoside hydrolase family 2 TIM barrel-domain containing protein [Kiritimatiellia bacterium]